MHEVERDRRRHRRGRRQRRDRQACRQHARHRDHQQHQEHHHRVGDDVEAGRVEQDHGPAQAVEQVEQHEPRSPFARGGERGGLVEEPPAIADDGGMDAEHADRSRPRPAPACIQKPNSHAGRNHQQHDDVGGRHAGLGVLPQQFGVEGRAGAAGSTLTGRAPRAPAAPPTRRVLTGACDRRLRRKLDNLRLFCGITHQTTQILPANRAGFCIVYLWR